MVEPIEEGRDMAKRNTENRRRAEARKQEILAAEDRAKRLDADALARVEAEGLWAAVEKAQAALVRAEPRVIALRDELVRHTRPSHLVTPFPYQEALEVAESEFELLEARFKAVFEKYIGVMNAGGYWLNRATILKAADRDDALGAPRRAAQAARKPSMMKKRREMYEQIKREHHDWKDEAIAFEMADREKLPSAGAVKRMRRARGLSA